jgi:hypothetical protein
MLLVYMNAYELQELEAAGVDVIQTEGTLTIQHIYIYICLMNCAHTVGLCNVSWETES